MPYTKALSINKFVYFTETDIFFLNAKQNLPHAFIYLLRHRTYK